MKEVSYYEQIAEKKGQKAGIPKRNPHPTGTARSTAAPTRSLYRKNRTVPPKNNRSHPVQKRANRIVFGAGTSYRALFGRRLWSAL